METVVPAHSVLDDLADKFGYDAAGQALKSARVLSARMVEQAEIYSETPHVVSYFNYERVADVWFRQEKPLCFRAGGDLNRR